jgi:hypothetical protein
MFTERRSGRDRRLQMPQAVRVRAELDALEEYYDGTDWQHYHAIRASLMIAEQIAILNDWAFVSGLASDDPHKQCES